MTDGSIRPVNVLRSPRSVIVTKFVITTSSLGSIISARNIVKTMSLPLKFSLAKANAARVITTIMSAVVAIVNITVLRKYLASGTAVKASL